LLLEQHNLHDKVVANYNSEQRNIFRNIPWLLLAFPIYLLGILHNYLPYKLPMFLGLKITKDVTFLTAINFSLGIVCFSGFYLTYGFLFYELLGSHFLAFLYTWMIAIAGFSSYYYWHFATRLWHKWRLINIVKSDKTLLNLRKEIIEELEKSRADYLVQL
jgi:hypothetical protein